jgi:hypothetical protein
MWQFEISCIYISKKQWGTKFQNYVVFFGIWCNGMRAWLYILQSLGLCDDKRKESETNIDFQHFHNIGTPNIDLFPTRTNRNCFLQSFLTSYSMGLQCSVDKLGCCLTLNEQFFSYFMARTSYIFNEMMMMMFILYSTNTLITTLYSVSSLKQ